MEADIKSKPGPARFSAIEFMGALVPLWALLSCVTRSGIRTSLITAEPDFIINDWEKNPRERTLFFSAIKRKPTISRGIARGGINKFRILRERFPKPLLIFS